MKVPVNQGGDSHHPSGTSTTAKYTMSDGIQLRLCVLHCITHIQPMMKPRGGEGDWEASNRHTIHCTYGILWHRPIAVEKAVSSLPKCIKMHQFQRYIWTVFWG